MDIEIDDVVVVTDKKSSYYNQMGIVVDKDKYLGVYVEMPDKNIVCFEKGCSLVNK